MLSYHRYRYDKCMKEIRDSRHISSEWHNQKKKASASTITGWWARATPLKNMSSSVGMISNPIYGKIKFMATSYHQPEGLNHQWSTDRPRDLRPGRSKRRLPRKRRHPESPRRGRGPAATSCRKASSASSLRKCPRKLRRKRKSHFKNGQTESFHSKLGGWRDLG